jgi:tRNA threonylcarbamoyladenosine biosynthesis protein TsaE
MTDEKIRLLLPDRQATAKFGAALAESIDDRAVIALIGTLGAGKTTLVQAVAKALDVKEVVTSPTFTMLNEYHSGRKPLYHMDLYRLSEEAVPAPLDLLLAEIEEFVDTPMVLMVEWAELFPFVGESPDSTVSTENPAAGAAAPAQNSGGGTTLPAVKPRASYLDQLDHLVIKLGYQVDTGGGTNHINKDEEARIADVWSAGDHSSQLLIRLRDRVAAMLIYS